MSRRPVHIDEVAAIGGAAGVIGASFAAFHVLDRTQSVLYFLIVLAGFAIGIALFAALAKMWNSGTEGEAVELIV